MEQLFLESQALIQELVTFVCRKSHFSPADSEDFHQEVLLKLVEDDFRVLRERVGSSLRNFLKVVILRAGQDFRNRIWGKYRDRTEAKRLGETALKLERLLALDGLSYEEARETLRTNHKIELTDPEFDLIRARLPPRMRRQLVPVDQLLSVVEPSLTPEEALLAKAAAIKQAGILARLKSAVEQLSPEQQLLLKLNYEEGMKLSAIARIQNVPQKPLYAERDRALSALRRLLEQEGISKEDLEEIFRRLQGPAGADGPEERDASGAEDRMAGENGPKSTQKGVI